MDGGFYYLSEWKSFPAEITTSKTSEYYRKDPFTYTPSDCFSLYTFWLGRDSDLPLQRPDLEQD
jgi:hypothetical protein